MPANGYDILERLKETLQEQIRFAQDIKARAEEDIERSKRMIKNMDAARDRLKKS